MAIAAGAILATRSGGGDGIDVPDDGIVVEPRPGEPRALRAKVGAFLVKLAWEPGDGELETAKYLVRRDGDVYAEVRGTTFEDDDVVPASRYTYEVVAVSRDGTASTAGAKVKVRTPIAPPAAARLSGDYVVKWEETSHFGFSSFGREAFKGGWFMKPDCHDGPCTTTLSDDGRLDTKIVLELAQGSYSGGGSVPFLARCGSSRSGGIVTIRLRPTDAKALGGVWRVFAFEGTVSERIPAQSGCVASGADWAVAGKLVG